jgi:hypothetical protein
MRIALALCLLVLLAVEAARADAQTETHAAVSQALEAFRQASLANDASKLDTLMADDCTAIVGPGLLVTKPQLLSALRDGSLIFNEVTFDDVVAAVVRKPIPDSKGDER